MYWRPLTSPDAHCGECKARLGEVSWGPPSVDGLGNLRVRYHCAHCETLGYRLIAVAQIKATIKVARKAQDALEQELKEVLEEEEDNA